MVVAGEDAGGTPRTNLPFGIEYDLTPAWVVLCKYLDCCSREGVEPCEGRIFIPLLF